MFRNAPKILYALLFCLSFATNAQRHQYISIETAYGRMVVQLSNETPVHRDNFIGLVRHHYFDTTTFHRIVPRFVIQGGEPDAYFETPVDTNVLKNQRLMPEFPKSLFHKRGAFCMGRDENPLKASFFTQFYIVQGRVYSDEELNTVEQKRLHGQKISPERRAIYKTTGGTPQLDGSYTVFGEVVEGLEVLDRIASVKTNKDDQPLEAVWMKVRMLKKKQARDIEKKLNSEP